MAEGYVEAGVRFPSPEWVVLTDIHEEVERSSRIVVGFLG